MSAAIVLAESIGADLLLIDDRAGATLAQRRGLAVTGTLGVMDLASRAGLLDLRNAFVRLQKTNSLLSWWKSSFFLWYCAVRLGNASPFFELQWRPYRLPVPKAESADFLRKLDTYARAVIEEENNFMSDVNRHTRKDALDEDYHTKARNRHNPSGNRISLAIDREVFDFLGFTSKDRRFIAQTLRDIEMSDFGALEELKAVDQDE